MDAVTINFRKYWLDKTGIEYIQSCETEKERSFPKLYGAQKLEEIHKVFSEMFGLSLPRYLSNTFFNSG